ncbi:MAG: Omp28-related outer membrane protein [Caldisericia bacterium]|nr:Omp28-related outer membrane protein [Caldisericia bacterium]
MKRAGIVLLILTILISQTSIMGGNIKAESGPTPDIIGGLPSLGLFLGPTFLHFDGARLYIVEQQARRIQGIYPKSEFSFGVYGQHNGQIGSPSGITTYKGTSYVCDNINDKIMMYDKEGKYTGEFKIVDPKQTRILNQPRGIAQYQSKLYIANTGSSNIIICDVTGKYIDVFDAADENGRKISEPTDVAVSSDKVFVTDPSLGEIFVYDLNGKIVSSIPSKNCWAIYGNDNKVVVTDYIDNKVRIYNSADLTEISSFGEAGSRPGQLSKPMGVAILEDKIYVSSYDNNRVDIFDLTGKYIGIFGLESKDAMGSFGAPTGVAYYGEKIFVADSARHKIVIYNKSGAFDSEFGQFGSGDKDLNTPSGVAVDDSNIYVADTGNNCVKIFAYDGAYKKTIGSFGNGQGKLSRPSDVAVIPSLGKLFVSDSGNNLIQEFTLSGDFSRQFGGFGSNPGKFNNPLGIATDGSRLIVADSANCRVQEFLLKDFSYQRSYGEKGRGIDKLYYPTKCTIDGSGKIYITDTYNHRIQVFDSRTDFSYVYGQNGGPGNINYMIPAVCPEEKQDPNAYGWYNFPSGIAIDEFGCYVADTFNHRIQYVDYKLIFSESPFAISPTYVDFGVIGAGQDAVQKIIIRNLSGGVLSGIISIPDKDTQWLKSRSLTFNGDASPIELFINSNASPGTYETDIQIITNKDIDDKGTTIHVKAIIGDDQGYYIEMDSFINTESSDRIDIPIKIVSQNNYTGNVALEVLTPPPNTYGQFSSRLLVLSKQNDSILTIKSSKVIGKGIYKVTIKALSPLIKFETKRDITIFVNKNRSFDNKTILVETFTAKWCINCPYAHRAAERILEERGDIRMVPLMYYVEAKEDNIEPYLYYIPADKRYAWYGKSGLPTTYFDGQNSLVGGDNDDERKKPPKDKQPCDRFTGTTFTYNRYNDEVKSQIQYPSTLSIFFEQNIKNGYIDLNLTINPLVQIDSKNLFLYVVLTEDSIYDPGVNGDEFHNLAVREMYTSEKGEPINLVAGTTFKKLMHLKIPSYVNENNARLVVWVQRNTSKEVLQTSALKLNYQGIKNNILVKSENSSLQVEIDKESTVKYNITNVGTRTEIITLKPDLGVQDWEWAILQGSKELPKGESVITLESMESTTVTVNVKPPLDTPEGIKVDFTLHASTSNITGSSTAVTLYSIPKLPPDFSLQSPVQRIDLSRRTTATITVPIKQINEFDGVVTLTNCTENPSIKVSIEPETGIPPFESKLTITGGEELNLGDYRVCLLASGITSRGETIEHKLEIPVNVMYANIVLEANPRKVISCSENQSCHSTNIDIKLSTPIEVSECKFSVRYDPTVLTTSHRNLGAFFGSNATMDFIDRSSEGVVTIHVKGKLSKGDGIICTLMMRGMKGVSKAGSQIDVCDVQMEDAEGRVVLSNIGCTATKVDIISQIAPPILTCDIKDGMVLDQDVVILKGTCKTTDPDYHVSLTVNGRPAIVKADGTWEYAAKLREGVNTFVLVAHDETGGSTGYSFAVTRDSTPPQIGVTNIKDNGHTKNPFFELEGWVDEKVTLTINDEEVQQDQFKEFKKILNLVKGKNVITLKAVDQLGKTAEITLTIWLDSKIIINLWLNQTKYSIDGKEFKLGTAPTSSAPPLPKEFAGSTFMPIREVAEALGATISWDAQDKKVTITQIYENKSKIIELWIGKKVALVNDTEMRIDDKNKLYPIIVGGKTLLPLRFVATSLGAKVEYVAAEKKIVLTYPEE